MHQIHILGKHDTAAQLKIVIYAGRLILVKLHWSGLDRKGNSAVGSPAHPRPPDSRCETEMSPGLPPHIVHDM